MSSTNRKMVQERQSTVLFQEVFTPFQSYQPAPRTKYTKLWRLCNQEAVKKLFMTVVESPSLQLVSSQVKVRRSCKGAVITSNECVPRPILASWRHQRFTLDYFRSEPFSPFIPDLILGGVNLVEHSCYQSCDWSVYYTCQKSADRSGVESALQLYIAEPTNSHRLRVSLARATLPDVAMCLVTFLTLFEKKPLHVDNHNLGCLLDKPLYDKFLRPNPSIRDVVRACVLKTSRTEVDTLAFMMIHLLHIWEYTNMPLMVRAKLARLFGPRLISFEDPVHLYKTEYSHSPQAALLEAILEICDNDFWNTLNFCDRGEIFSKQTDMEVRKARRSSDVLEPRKRPPEFTFMCNPYSLFPSLSQTPPTGDNNDKEHQPQYDRNFFMRNQRHYL